MKAKIIALEGINGAGKSTMVPVVSQTLKELGIDHICTSEPKGTDLGQQLVKLIHANKPLPITELLLMVATRYEHYYSVIKPALNKGLWVVTDRYDWSTEVYQGIGKGLLGQVWQFEEGAHLDQITADFYLLFDVSPECGLCRAQMRDNGNIQLAELDLALLAKYYRRLTLYTHRSRSIVINAVINAERDCDAVAEQVAAAMRAFVEGSK